MHVYSTWLLKLQKNLNTKRIFFFLICAHVGVFWLLANHEGKKNKKKKHNVLGGRVLTSNTSEQNGEEDSEQPRRAAEWIHTESVYAL